jgi:hypothetical protein
MLTIRLHNMRTLLRHWFVLWVCLPGILNSPVFAGTQEQIYFANTENELRVYRITGSRPGTTMLVIGGIHNEPGGYLAADQFVSVALSQGSLIVVPRANFFTIIEDHRGIHGDMNRKFGHNLPADDQDARTVKILKDLIAESDVILNLHDGTGFFRPTDEDNLHNPRMFGQSIIADTDVYHRPNGQTLYLKDIAERVIQQVNKDIPEPEYQFHFNNHQTESKSTRHAEQRGSATYYALTNLQIPAFGIETSKQLPFLQMKVNYQVMIIREFMREFDITPQSPGAEVLPPLLKFVSVAVNDREPVVVLNDDNLYVAQGDIVRVTHIEANYERGLSADIEGLGSRQDFEKPLQINQDTRIIIRKDQFECGGIQLVIGQPANQAVATQAAPPSGDYLLVEINDERRQIPMDDEVTIPRTASFRILGISPELSRYGDCRVNFYGYAPPNRTAEDRGYTIHLDSDLIPKYSVNGRGDRYLIRMQKGDTVIRKTTIRLVQPQLDFVLMQYNDTDQIWRRDGEALSVFPSDRIEFTNIRTSLPAGMSLDVQVTYPGANTPTVYSQWPVVIDIPDDFSNIAEMQIPVTFTHNQSMLGSIYLNLTKLSPKQNARQIQSTSR